MYTFVCESCGGVFKSKVDPTNWRTKKCNKCSGKPYTDYPVDASQAPQGYSPRPVPTTTGVQYTQPKQATHIQPKKQFDKEAYIADIIETYLMLKNALDTNTLTIPEDNICNWVTSIMIQKEKYDR